MRYSANILCLSLLLLQQGEMAQADQLPNHKMAPVTTYAVRYERYGLLGLYHVSLAVDVLRDGVTLQRLHIDGAGRISKFEFNLGICKAKFALPPAFLAGYVNPKGYKQHFLGLFTSNEFGPTYTLNEAQGAKFVGMAHHAMSVLNRSDKRLYLTIPFQLGPVQYWTSNSVVASLVKAANEEGIDLPVPIGGCYPGFAGPFLPKSLFLSDNDDSESHLGFPVMGVIFFWGMVFLLLAGCGRAIFWLRSILRRPRRKVSSLRD